MSPILSPLSLVSKFDSRAMRLCSALKVGGVEVARERWDEADAHMDEDEDMDSVSPVTPRSVAESILPDWTRTSLPAGAPSAKAPSVAAPKPTVDVLVDPFATAA